MKIESLRKNRKKQIVLGITIFSLVVLSVVLITSKAKYKHVQDMKLVEGLINYKLADLEIAKIMQKDSGSYYEVQKIPTSGYTLNTTESYCEVNKTRVSVSMELKSDGLYVGKVKNKGTKCYVYFDVKGKTMDQILASYNTSTRSDFSTVYTASTTKHVFTASDGLGTSKYFAGAPTDNYVKFGGFYWRIIRMNGDKTTRLIYAGNASVIDGLSNKQTVLANAYDDSSTQYTQIKTSAFNLSDVNNACVGFKYEVGVLSGTTNKSAILNELDTWYEANLKTNYGKYIDGSTGFCGDRTPYTLYDGTTVGGGTGTTITWYGDFIRLYKNNRASNASPVLTCANTADLYTTSDSNRGNKALENPIGLINVNELAMAGGVAAKENNSYYLRTNNDYWTMSPSSFVANGALVYYVNTSGYFYGYDVDNTLGIRPVINLASTTHFEGTGTWNDPFIVVG